MKMTKLERLGRVECHIMYIDLNETEHIHKPIEIESIKTTSIGKC